MATVLVLLSVLAPSTAFAYTILWDTSHGVFVSPTYGGEGYQPVVDGYYETLANHLSDNGFTMAVTTGGFTDNNLAQTNVAVVCVTSAVSDPYTPEEVTRLTNFVNSGGGLLIMGDRTAAYNANIQPVAAAFGIDDLYVSDVLSDSPVTYEIYTSDLADHPVFDGIGNIFVYASAEMDVSGDTFAIARQEGTGKIIAAVAEVGNGRVVVIGDSSLWSWVPDYEEYFYEVQNPQFSVNTFTYLAVPEPASVLLFGLGLSLLVKRRPA